MNMIWDQTADILKRKLALDQKASNPHRSIFEQVSYDRWIADALEILLLRLVVLDRKLDRLVPSGEVVTFPEDKAR